MLSVKINPEYFKVNKLPTTAPVNLVLNIPATVNAAAVFPLAGNQIQGSRINVTTNGVVIDETALKYESDNARNAILNQVAEAITYRRILCTDVATGVLRTDADVYAYANSGSWGSLPAGTALLAENNLSDIEDPVAAATNLGLGASTTKSFTQVATGFVIVAGTDDNIAITSNIAINLGTTYLAKKLSIVSTTAYTIVVPAGVVMTYNGIAYTSVTKTVPAGYGMELWQISASAWILTGFATLN
jgi:hypothetical protein